MSSCNIFASTRSSGAKRVLFSYQHKNSFITCVPKEVHEKPNPLQPKISWADSKLFSLASGSSGTFAAALARAQRLDRSGGSGGRRRQPSTWDSMAAGRKERPQTGQGTGAESCTRRLYRWVDERLFWSLRRKKAQEIRWKRSGMATKVSIFMYIQQGFVLKKSPADDWKILPDHHQIVQNQAMSPHHLESSKAPPERFLRRKSTTSLSCCNTFVATEKAKLKLFPKGLNQNPPTKRLPKSPPKLPGRPPEPP